MICIEFITIVLYCILYCIALKSIKYKFNLIEKIITILAGHNKHIFRNEIKPTIDGLYMYI